MIARLKKSMEIYKSPVTQKIMVCIFFAVILIEAIILVPSYFNKEKDLVNATAEEFRALADGIMMVEGLAPEDQLRALRANSKLLLAQWDQGASLSEQPYFDKATQTIMMSRTYGQTEQKHIVMTIDAQSVSEELLAFVFRIIGLVIIIAIFMTVSTMVIVGHLCIFPLLTLEKALQESSKGATFQELPEEFIGRKDELGDIARSYQTLGQNVNAAFAEILVLARFPSENPNPILRCRRDYSILYLNSSASDQPSFFSDEKRTHIGARLSATVRKAIETGEQQTKILETDRRIFSISVVPIPAHDYCNIYGQDITSQVKAERALQGLNSRLEELVDERTAELRLREMEMQATISASLDAIVIMGADGAIWEYSKSAEDIFGYKKDEVIGTKLSDKLIPERMRKAHEDGLQAHLTDGKGYVGGRRFEMVALRKDGSEFPVEMTMDLAEMPTEVFFVSYMRDISKRKNFEKEIVTARNQAELTLRMQTERLSNVCIELKHPLTDVIAGSDKLLETDISAQQKGYVQSIRRSAESALTASRSLNEIDQTADRRGKRAAPDDWSI